MSSVGVRALTKRIEGAPSPLRLFERLTDGGRAPHTVALESAEPSSRRSQRSMLVPSAALSIVCRGEEVRVTALNRNGARLLPRLPALLDGIGPLVERDGGYALRFARPPRDASDAVRLQAPSCFSVLRGLAAGLRAADPASAEAIFLPGLFAYDLVAQFEELPEAPDSGRPDYVFYLADQLISIDHLAQRTQLTVNVFGDDEGHYAAVEALGRIDAVVKEVLADRAPRGEAPATARVERSVDCSDAEFAERVQRLKAHITAGDVFQIVPSRTFSAPCADPLRAYAKLREVNPSPYQFFMNTGAFTVFGASPESAVKVDGRARTVEISPIAGTRPRGLRDDGVLDSDLDSRMEAELRLDAKECAEHMMLVDLARNDVARVSKHGTRAVDELLRVVRYSHVMHLVSRVRGELREGLDALHAYQASMNMGTLTGAPKIRAMELLRRHEPGRRDYYGGAIGYLRGDGDFDTAIVIRAALVEDGIARVRAGAGVVHDSDPLAEAEETRRKAEAVLRALAVQP